MSIGSGIGVKPKKKGGGGRGCGQSGGRGAGFGAGGGHVMFYIDTFHSHIHKHTFNGVKMLLLAFFEPKEPLLFCSI